MLEDLGVLGVSGEDRQSWLNGMVTNDVAKLQPGARLEACFTNVKGKVVALADVWHAGDCLRVVTERERMGALLAMLERLIVMEDVTIADASADWSVLTVQGPDAAAVLDRASLAGLSSDRTGSGGVDLLVAAAESDEAIARLVAAGAVLGSARDLDALRLEAGLSRWGIDVTEELFPQEARLEDRRVSFTKGCYVGQEPVTRLQSRGHANRFLTLLDLADGAAPAAGAVVRRDDAEVGRVTSAARGPTIGRTVALALVRRDAAQPGTNLTIDGLPATVAAGPFVPATSGAAVAPPAC